MDLEARLEKLATAFPPEPIDGGRAFAEWGKTHLDAEKFSDAVQGQLWTELQPAFLEYHHDALVFMGPSSVADYLPAYLMSMLRDDPVLSSMPSFLLGVLTRSRDAARFDARFSRLTPMQRRAVGEALTDYAESLGPSGRRTEVNEALDSFWRADLEGGT